MIFGREPALFIGLIQALIALAMGFGLNFSPEQQALLMAAVIAFASFVVRHNVYSENTVQKMKAKLTAPQPTPTDAELAEG